MIYKETRGEGERESVSKIKVKNTMWFTTVYHVLARADIDLTNPSTVSTFLLDAGTFELDSCTFALDC
jgi:hypothetical protein